MEANNNTPQEALRCQASLVIFVDPHADPVIGNLRICPVPIRQLNLSALDARTVFVNEGALGIARMS